jgi:CRP-like cAMP-binding protein
MDVHRVSLIDASGAMVLSQIHERLKDRGIALLLAGLTVEDRHGRALIELVGDALPRVNWYPDADRAVEAAEVRSLRAATGGIVTAAVPLSRSSLMSGLDADQCERLASHLAHQRLAAGERLFAQGDSGDRLYVLTEGSISVLGGSETPEDHAGRQGHRVRFVTCSPGMMLGEVAMLDRRGRSVEAVADLDSVVHALDEAALDALARVDPTLAALVYRNIATHLSARLRIASGVQAALRTSGDT